MRMTAELMQCFLPSVSLEISVDATDHGDAKNQMDLLRAMLYLEGVAPTIAPFATSHSINEYAGINARSSKIQRDKLPEGLKDGITAKDSRVEGWPLELTFSLLRGEVNPSRKSVDEGIFHRATEAVTSWKEIESRFSQAATLRAALVKAPLMPDYASSILHIWQAFETVFGKGPELSFRMSLTLAELCGPVASRMQTYADAKQSYKDRSSITHGTAKNVSEKQWMRAWSLLIQSVQSILHRQDIPSEDELFSDLLSR
ncbi:hypothetical protein A3731_07785 [Roseovarius sp. HI0049]|nr:hypothetical protein A3731_07785 [Roseovarius sp. HI0049]